MKFNGQVHDCQVHDHSRSCNTPDPCPWECEDSYEPWREWLQNMCIIWTVGQLKLRLFPWENVPQGNARPHVAWKSAGMSVVRWDVKIHACCDAQLTCECTSTLKYFHMQVHPNMTAHAGTITVCFWMGWRNEGWNTGGLQRPTSNIWLLADKRSDMLT